MIKRGHYQSRASLNSETPEIIRVLGPNKHKEKVFKLQDGTEKSEAEIENSYVFLDTVSVEKVAPKKNIFAFDPIDISESSNIDVQEILGDASVERGNFPQTSTQSPSNKIIPSFSDNKLDKMFDKLLDNQNHILSLVKSLSEIPSAIPTTPKVTVTAGDILDVIKKIRIDISDKPNISTSQAYSVILPLDYDISKVQAIADLFEFPISDVIDVIIRQSLSDHNSMESLIQNIKTSIGISLSGNDRKPEIDMQGISNTTALNITETSGTPNVTVPNNIPIDIDNNISSIDDFLNQFR